MLTLAFVVGVLLTAPLLVAAMRPEPEVRLLKKRLRIIESYGRADTDDRKLFELEEATDETLAGRITAFVERYPIARRFQLLLVHAGSEMSIGTLILRSLVVAVVCAAPAAVALRNPLVACAAVAVGAWLPFGYLAFGKKKRLRKFNEALPDAIDLIARSLRAGHSMGSAIEIVAERCAEPLAGEFDRVFQQQKFGLRFRDALLEMAERVPSTDLRFLITAILVQKETGGDLVETLDRTTAVIRDRVRIEGEVRTKTAQGRLTGLILGLLPIILLAGINALSPGYSMLLFSDPLGREMLYAGAGLMTVGGLVIRRIVKIQV